MWARGQESSAPAWVGVCQVAEAWGVPPWEVDDSPRIDWFWRTQAYRHAQAIGRENG